MPRGSSNSSSGSRNSNRTGTQRSSGVNFLTTGRTRPVKTRDGSVSYTFGHKGRSDQIHIHPHKSGKGVTVSYYDRGKPVARGTDPNYNSGGCYIATATFSRGGSVMDLDILRNWRDKVLNRSRLGRSLEAFYDRTGPIVAKEVGNHPLLANCFLYPFVKPAVWLAKRRMRSKWVTPIYDFLVYSIFLAGLAYGSVVYLFFRE